MHGGREIQPWSNLFLFSFIILFFRTERHILDNFLRELNFEMYEKKKNICETLPTLPLEAALPH